ncbi:MAG: VpsF family polysaccharide biosynthesis protein [Mesorhizobium sp.]
MTARWTIGGQSPVNVGPRALRYPWRGVVDLLLVLAVVALMSLSDYALEFFGIPYNSLGGSIISKIHPATYLLAVALGLAVIGNPNPVVYVLGLLGRCLGSALLLVASILMWVFIARNKPGYSASFLIDTLIAASLIVMLFADAGNKARLIVARLVHCIMVVNCMLSIVEGLTGWRLFPFVLGGHEQTWEYRATALLGHPLIGGLVTGVYAVILLTVHDVRGLGERWRWPILLLCMAAMPFIGSRTAFVIVVVTAAAVAGLRVLRFLRGEPIDTRKLLALLVLAPLGVVVLAILFQQGLFDNFIGRFLNDNNSAQTRFRLYDLFDNLNMYDLFVGQSFVVLDTNVRLNGLSEGIENSWAGHLLRYGVVMSVVLWCGVAAWFGDVLRAAGRAGILPLVFVFLVISTTTGISAKSSMLTIPAVLILSLVARVPQEEAARVDNALLSRIGSRFRA